MTIAHQAWLVVRYNISEADLMVMVEIEKNSSINQRALAKTFNIILEKINYCFKALIDIRFINLDNFSNSQKNYNIYIL